MQSFLASLLSLALVFPPQSFAEKDTAKPADAPSPAANTPAASAPRPAVPHTLLDGTAVKLRLGENLTSATAKTGQQVLFEVTEEVDVDGLPVISKGAQALATVTDAYPKKSMGRGGKLDVNIDSVRLVDGEKAQLRAVQDNKGGGHVGAMTGAMVATGIIFFPAAPLFLFVHGKDINIPKGTEITAFVQGDMKLEMAKFAPGSPVGAPVAVATAAPVQAAPQNASLTIDANAQFCDITVDGNFVGSTPSTINLPPGQHKIVVSRSGYKDWTRTMTVTSGTLHLNADMVRAY